MGSRQCLILARGCQRRYASVRLLPMASNALGGAAAYVSMKVYIYGFLHMPPIRYGLICSCVIDQDFLRKIVCTSTIPYCVLLNDPFRTCVSTQHSWGRQPMGRDPSVGSTPRLRHIMSDTVVVFMRTLIFQSCSATFFSCCAKRVRSNGRWQMELKYSLAYSDGDDVKACCWEEANWWFDGGDEDHSLLA